MKVAALVVGPGGTRLRELEETTKRRFFLVGREASISITSAVWTRDAREGRAEAAGRSGAGDRAEARRGRVHDAHAGVGKVEGLDVVVGDAAKLVGKKVKVRINVVTEGLAWAELVSPVEQTLEPLTAESEAEKPTRARRSSSRTKDEPESETDTEPELEGDEAVTPEGEAEQLPDLEGEDDLVIADGTDGEPGAAATPKKRTRRGTRGGRNRKKKPAGATAAQNGSEAPLGAEAELEAAPDAEEAVAEPEEPGDAPAAGPVIHVPDRDLGAPDGDEDGVSEGSEPGAAPKKRTRRGSRGGKNRRKKPATAAGATATAEAVEVAVEDTAEPAAPPEPEQAAQNGSSEGSSDGDWGYTPMSEWGIHDK